MTGFLKPFDGFVRTDFEVYTPDKWSSNLYNLQRMQVKQKMEALAAVVRPHLTQWNLGLEHETSTERPSIWNQKKVDGQWLTFSRSEKTQRDLQAIIDRERSIAENIDDPAHHHRHIVLALRLDQRGIAALCGIHRSAWLDRHNLKQKWTIPHERLRLAQYLRDFKEAEWYWVFGEEQCPIGSATEAILEPTLSDAPSIDGWIAIEHRFGLDDGSWQSPDFALQLVTVLGQLRPFYEFCAWSKVNDHLSMAKVVTEEKKAKRRLGAAAFEENDVVTIVGGLFAGRTGVVAGFDQGGKVKVRVGNLSLPVNAGSLKRVQKP